MAIEPQFTLHSLVRQAQQIESALVESRGELTPELEALLANLDITMTQKLDGYSFIMERFEAEASFFKARADLYSKTAEGLLSFQKRLKERIKLAMVALGKDEISGNEVRFKLSNAAPKLVIENEGLLAPSYQKIVQTMVPDKEKIKEDLSIGLSVQGAHLEGGKALRVYMQKGE